MKRPIQKILFLFIIMVLPVWLNAQAQQNGKPQGSDIKWAMQTPFEQKVFIENRGQIDAKANEGNGKVLFSTEQQGICFYWSAKGLTYKIKERYLSEDAEKEMAQGNEEEVERKIQTRYHYLNMEWVGANPDPEIISEEPVEYYYTYANPNDKSEESGIKAPACKKIVYKNIYPNIDVEYTLPEKGGIKYSLIVHPGADIGIIKMRYGGTQKINLNSNGEIEINSTECGNYMEHRPQTYYRNGVIVASSFIVENGTIGFSIPAYDKTQTLVIDPWVSVISFPPSINPSFTPYNNSGYDLAYDFNGNVWVFGGGDSLHLAKYNSGGTLQWVYTLPLSDGDALVGDFDVNKTSGTAYICQGGFNGGIGGAQIVKVNSQGLQIGILAHASNHPQELNRIRLTCQDSLVTAGGGVGLGNWQVGIADTNLASFTGSLVTSSPQGDHDVSLMCLDPLSNSMYISFNRPDNGSPDYLNDNEMYKLPTPGFAPATWNNPGPIYHFQELSTMYYSGPYNWPPNTGYARMNVFNGMVCGNGFLYTYNGDSLIQWNKNAGTLLKQVLTGGTVRLTGGLDLDLCENVYAGVGNKVKEYDANLNLINTYAIPAGYTTTYDLKVDKNKNLLYVCGDGYVCAIAITPSTVTLNTSSTPAVCICNGTATVNVIGGCNANAFSYKWAPGGQTTQTVTGLCPGHYTVTAISDCFMNFSDTITVGGSSVLSTKVSTTPAACGVKGSAFVSIKSGTGPFTYNWSPSGQTTDTATGLSSGSYTVTVKDSNGCTNTDTITVSNKGGLRDSIVSQTNVSCFGGNNGIITLGVKGGILPYTFAWNSGASTQNISGLSVGTYTVFIKDSGGGCTGIASATIIQPAKVKDSVTILVNEKCFGDSTGSITLGNTGGTPGYTYNWSNGKTSSNISNLSVGTYSITITDANGCKNVDSVTVTQPAVLKVSGSSVDAKCFGSCDGQATISASGGTVPYNYKWSVGVTTTTVSTLCKGTDTIFVTDSHGCKHDTVFTINEPTAMSFTRSSTATGCGLAIGSAGVVASGGSPTYTYKWNNGGTTSLISNLSKGTYTCTITDSHGCQDTVQVNVPVVNPDIVPGFTVDKLEGCYPVCINFTDTSSVPLPDKITGWLWNFGDGDTSHQQNPTHCYTKPGTYAVNLTVYTKGGCSAAKTSPGYITVYDHPHADFSMSPQPTDILNPTIYFTDKSTDPYGIKSWYWPTFGDNSDSTSIKQNPVHTYADTGSYCATLVVTNIHGCKDSTTQCLEINPYWTLYIPNAFTPQGDGINETFNAKGVGIKKYEMWIFDRWGMQLFYTNSLYKGWDGKVQNGSSHEICQEDTYVYLIEATDCFYKEHKYIGRVTIIK